MITQALVTDSTVNNINTLGGALLVKGLINFMNNGIQDKSILKRCLKSALVRVNRYENRKNVYENVFTNVKKHNFIFTKEYHSYLINFLSKNHDKLYDAISDKEFFLQELEDLNNKLNKKG